MKQVVENALTERTKSMLFDAGYRHAWSVNGPVRRSCLSGWIGKHGVVIVQEWAEGGGCSCYADWPLGGSIAELKAAIAEGPGEQEP